MLSSQISARAPRAGLFLFGALLIFASAMCYAVYLVTGSQLVKRVGSMRFTAYTMIVSTVPAVVQFLRPRAAGRALDLPARGLVVSRCVLATACTVLPVFLVAEALKRIGANQFALIGALGPVTTVLADLVLLEGALTGAADRSAARWSSAACLLVTLKKELNMDLGIKGKTALVCAASKGLGKGCAMALAREGVNLVITARGKEALEATADEIRNEPPARRSPRSPATSPRPKAAPRRSPPARAPTSSSTTPAARRRATSATGRATTGSRRSTPTCSRRSS